MRAGERGNAVIFILIAVALFAALAYTFTRSARTGQGNMTAGQAKLKAQELATFMQNVGQGVEKLRQRGCSINDISFAYPGSISGMSWMDDPGNPITAPADESCHVFRPAGANVAMNITLSDYQAPIAHFGVHHQQYNHMLFTPTSLGINFLNPEICKAYNIVVNNGADYSQIDFGQWTTANTFCHQEGNNLQNGAPNNQAFYKMPE